MALDRGAFSKQRRISRVMDYKLHNANCAEILPGEYLGAVDLILTSTPYDQMRTYSGNEFDFCKVANAIVPCLKKGGVLVWIVADQIINFAESLTSFRHALGFQERGLLMHQTLIFQNSGSCPISPRPTKARRPSNQERMASICGFEFHKAQDL